MDWKDLDNVAFNHLLVTEDFKYLTRTLPSRKESTIQSMERKHFEKPSFGINEAGHKRSLSDFDGLSRLGKTHQLPTERTNQSIQISDLNQTANQTPLLRKKIRGSFSFGKLESDCGSVGPNPNRQILFSNSLKLSKNRIHEEACQNNAAGFGNNSFLQMEQYHALSFGSNVWFGCHAVPKVRSKIRTNPWLSKDGYNRCDENSRTGPSGHEPTMLTKRLAVLHDSTNTHVN